MKCKLPAQAAGRRGMTLLELAIVIVVLLLMAGALMAGGRAWKRGADRAGCVLNLRNVQMAARCYQHLYGYRHGDRPQSEYGTQDISRHLFEKGYIEKRLYDQARGSESCPGGGTYTAESPDVFPAAGRLYLECSMAASDEHQPRPGSHDEW